MHHITKPFPDTRSGKWRACAAKHHALTGNSGVGLNVDAKCSFDSAFRPSGDPPRSQSQGLLAHGQDHCQRRGAEQCVACRTRTAQHEDSLGTACSTSRNRLVRTRMLGGVGRVTGDGGPYPIRRGPPAGVAAVHHPRWRQPMQKHHRPTDTRSAVATGRRHHLRFTGSAPRSCSPSPPSLLGGTTILHYVEAAQQESAPTELARWSE